MGVLGQVVRFIGTSKNSGGCFGIRGSEPACVTRLVSEHDQPHMWNGPRCKELLNRFHPRGRCVHMYGLEARYMTAGLDEIRETSS